jgi:hypothetical protein
MCPSAMEFLLIVSALLSAVTGALTGTRGVEAAPPHEAAAEAVVVTRAAAVAVAPIAQTETPAAPLTEREQSLPIPASAPPASAPLETDRLIE